MKDQINLFTIGFTQKNAQKFFESLKKSGVKRVIDTRLNNISQLAGFTKKTDLEYFLKTIGDIEYVHILDLAPTKDILDEYKKNKGDWGVYKESSGNGWRGTIITTSGQNLNDAKITDPVFVENLNKGYQPTGSYLVTVSLSMPFAPHPDWEGEHPCWKLIAGVIKL
jgi:hypothetical protein